VNITEVRVKLVRNRGDKLLAFGSITIDNEFVIRDLKIVKGTSGPFVAMPSRKLADRCPRCRTKNHFRANFCNECGLRLRHERAPIDQFGRYKLHADIAHPINQQCRDIIQEKVISAYNEELERSKQAGYKPQEIYSPEEMDAEIDYTDPPGDVDASKDQPEKGSSD
jgi:stage V sporulation protein G